MYLGQEFQITDWFIIHFTENPGMAFGMELGVPYGKIVLSIFRIIMMAAIAFYIFKLSKERAKTSFLVAVSLIFAGALGNIIDSILYGQIFTSSGGNISQYVPFGDGYSSVLYGKVVDMLYFPLFDGFFPSWFPIWGGEQFLFFRPVFNIADSSITLGIIIIIIFQKSFFSQLEIQSNSEN